MKPQCATIQMKAFEQYFHVVMFVMAVQGNSTPDETPVKDK